MSIQHHVGFDLDPILAKLKADARLKEQGIKFGIGQDYKRELMAREATRKLFLVRSTDTPASGTTSGSQQVVSLRFNIFLVVRDYSKDAAKTDKYVNKLRGYVSDALLAWQPQGAHNVITYAGGALVDLTDKVTIDRDSYQTQYIIAGPDKKGS